MLKINTKKGQQFIISKNKIKSINTKQVIEEDILYATLYDRLSAIILVTLTHVIFITNGYSGTYYEQNNVITIETSNSSPKDVILSYLLLNGVKIISGSSYTAVSKVCKVGDLEISNDLEVDDLK